MFTPAQITTIKAHIAASPDMASAQDYVIQGLFNTEVPDFYIYRSDLTVDEVMRNGMDWTRVDNLSVGKARIWEWMTRLGILNMSKVNVRAGVDATWVGTAADLAVRASIYVHGRRKANRLEKLLATGIGTTADPATAAFEGEVTAQQVSDIMGSV